MHDWARNVLVVEDEALVSGLLVETLQAANFDARAALNAVEAKRVVKDFDPDVVLLDIDLGPGVNGIDLSHILTNKFPGVGILFLTKFPDMRSAGVKESSIPAGSGFIRKELVGNTDYLISAMESVLREKRDLRHDLEPDRPLAALTRIQMDVLRLLASGYTNQEIARRRNKSVSSVEQLLNTLFKNLKINTDETINPRIEAVRLFIKAAGIPSRDAE